MEDDDLEEMRALRVQRKQEKKYFKPMMSNFQEPSSSRNSSGHGDSQNMAEIMGFSNFGKKARSFDLDAIFEQTRRTAIERNQNISSISESNKRTESGSDGPSTLKHSDSNESLEEEFIGPPIPQILKNDDDEDEEEDEDNDDDDNLEKKIPASHEIQLEHGRSTVSALALDPSGSRLITGGFDYDIKFWDFAGMDASLQSFRTLRPCESHNIKSLQYSVTGDSILVISGNSQAKVLDRDGFEIVECVKGDQYIVDMVNTKGHIAMLNGGCWHPKDREEFMTCSDDCTVRLWHIDDAKQHKHVVKPRAKNGLRIKPTCCSYNRDGRLVAAACGDGSIQIWDHRRNFVNTTYLLRDAHTNGSDTSCLCFSYSDKNLATRGGDDTLKLWDIRMFKKPVSSKEDLYNRFPMTDCAFSPDDKMVITGTSTRKGEKAGKLMFFETSTFNLVSDIFVTDSSIVRSLWHPKLNQIIVGCGNGFAKVYYSPEKSHRGAKLCVIKTKRKVKQVEMVTQQQIITPHALPLFREERARSTRKQMEKDRIDPVRSRRPDLPVTGPGQGGRIAAAGGTLSSYIIRNLGLKKKIDDEQDPREAILRFAEEASANPYWVAPAYSHTQPQPIFQNAEPKEEEEEGNNEPPNKKTKV